MSSSAKNEASGKKPHGLRTSSMLALYCLVFYLMLLGAYHNFLAGISDSIVASIMTMPCVLREAKDAFTTTTGQGPPPQLFFINDRTIRLDSNVSRPWLVDSTLPQPLYKLILTDLGWNSPNLTLGLHASRSSRSRELLQGMVDHPNFDPTISWSAIVKGTYKLDPNTRYYVFLDVETCFESNYPNYLPPKDLYLRFLNNSDFEGGRIYTPGTSLPCYEAIKCHYIFTVLKTIYEYPKSTLVVYNCRGNGPGPEFRKNVTTRQLSIVSESSPAQDLLTEIDMGLTPPPLNVVKLRPDELDAIYSCKDTNRPFLVTFVGNAKKDGPRRAMQNMSNGRDVLFMSKEGFKDKYFFLTFHESLKKTTFGATPRGDNLYSYRFTEVLSAGSIPVVHADGWVMPFHEALVDWNACAIIIPEAQVYETERILRSISKQEICRRQQKCLEIYYKYFTTPHGTVQGIIEALEKIHEQGKLLSTSR